MTAGNIIGSFKRTGIYPFNASVVTDEHLAPSTSVNPPKQHCLGDQRELNTNVNSTVHGTVDHCEPNTTANSNTSPQQNDNTLANFLHAKKRFMPPYKNTHTRQTVTGGQPKTEGRGAKQVRKKKNFIHAGKQLENDVCCVCHMECPPITHARTHTPSNGPNVISV